MHPTTSRPTITVTTDGAGGRLVEDRTGWSIRGFVRTARRYRPLQIRAGQHLLTAEDPLPNDLREALALIARPKGAH